MTIFISGKAPWALGLGMACFVLTSVASAPPNASPSAVYDVSSYYKACTRSEECTLVSTGCDGCCLQAPINRQYLSTYETEKAKNCNISSDPVCGCKNPVIPTSCQNGLCIIYTPATPHP